MIQAWSQERGRAVALFCTVLLLPALGRTRQAAAEEEPRPFTDEIVVTAQKREQALQDVAIHVTVLSAAEIAASRLEEVADLASQVPNLSVKTPFPGSKPVVTLRGVGLEADSAPNISPSAGVYVDQVFLCSPAFLSLQLFDMERIEVLKGPQGTLYGRNTTAGALNLLTRKPRRERSGRVLLGLGDRESLEAEGVLGGALSEGTFARLSLRSTYQGESFYTERRAGEDLGDARTYAGRAQLAWTRPGRERPTWSANLKLHYARDDSTTAPFVHFGTLDPITFDTCAAILAGRIDTRRCVDALGWSDDDGDPFTGESNVAPALDDEQLGATLTVSGVSGDTAWTSITGFENLDHRQTTEADGSPFTQVHDRLHDRIDQLSQELRLAGTSERANWIAGLFFSRDEVDLAAETSSDDVVLTRFETAGEQTTDTLAAFGHSEWRLADRATLTLGGRVTREEKRYAGGTVDANPFGTSLVLADFTDPEDPVFFPDPVRLSAIDAGIEDTEFSGKLALQHQASEGTMLYASLSRGYKSGGFFGGLTFSDAELEPFDEEILLAYEAGFKLRRPGNALRVVGSFFYYDYRDVQTFTQVSTAALTVLKLGNVDEAEVYGADLDLRWEPAPRWLVRAGVGVLRTRLGAFVTATGPVAAGNELPNAPELTWNTLARHVRQLGGDKSLTAQVSFSYSDAVFKEAVNRPYLAADDYSLLDARLALSAASGWELALWGENLGDERYVVHAVDNGIGVGGLLLNEPRRFGVSFSYRLH